MMPAPTKVGAPAPGVGHERHDGRRDDGGDVGAGVEQAGGVGALALREPQRHGLHRGREVAALAQAQGDAGDEEAAHAAHQRVPQGGDAPGDDRHGVSDLAAEAVDEPPEEQQADRVGPLEHGVHVAVLGVGPAQLDVQDRLQQRQDLAVDVVDGGRQEQQEADPPAVPSDRRSARRGHVASGSHPKHTRSQADMHFAHMRRRFTGVGNPTL